MEKALVFKESEFFTAQFKESIYSQDDKWCDCEECEDMYFVDDDENDECPKHHWRCSECDKIIQIG